MEILIESYVAAYVSHQFLIFFTILLSIQYGFHNW